MLRQLYNNNINQFIIQCIMKRNIKPAQRSYATKKANYYKKSIHGLKIHYHTSSYPISPVSISKYPDFNPFVLEDENILHFFTLRLKYLQVKQNVQYEQQNGEFICNLSFTLNGHIHSVSAINTNIRGSRIDAVKLGINKLPPPTVNESYDITKYIVMSYLSKNRFTIDNKQKGFNGIMFLFRRSYQTGDIFFISGRGPTSIEAEMDALQLLYLRIRCNISSSPKGATSQNYSQAIAHATGQAATSHATSHATAQENCIIKDKSPETENSVGNPQASSANGISRLDIGNINYLRSALQDENVVPHEGLFKCDLKWDWLDFDIIHQKHNVVGYGSSKAEAKANASLQMLSSVGYIDTLTPTDFSKAAEVTKSLAKNSSSVIYKCGDLLETSSSSLWGFFLPQVFRHAIYHFDKSQIDLLIDAIVSASRPKEQSKDADSVTMSTSSVSQLPSTWSHNNSNVAKQSTPSENGEGSKKIQNMIQHSFDDKKCRADVWEELIEITQFCLEERYHELGSHVLSRLMDVTLVPDHFISNEACLYFKKHRCMLALEYNAGLKTCLDSNTKGELYGNITSLQNNIFTVSGNYDVQDHDKLLFNEDNVVAILGDSINAIIAMITSFKISNYKYTMVLKVLFNPVDINDKLNSTCKILDLGSSIPHKRMVDSLRSFTLKKKFNLKSPIHHRFSPYIQNLFINSFTNPDAPPPPTIKMPSIDFGALIEGMPLTPAQTLACKSAMENELTIIQGPPGTGKTYVACAIIRCWLRLNSIDKILAVADSNIAADNLLEGLAELNITAIRVGQGCELDLQDRALQGMKRYAEYVNFKRSGLFKQAMTIKNQMISEAIKKNNIIIATCAGCGNELLSSEIFTRVIIDECAQSIECSNLVPLSHFCKQLVLIGDHKQLRPLILSTEALEKGLSISLLERLAIYCPSFLYMLKTQRRMHPSISQFPNLHYYDNQLSDGDNVFMYKPIKGFKWPCENFYVCFIDVSIGCAGSNYELTKGESKYNLKEVDVIVQLFENFIKFGDIKAKDIGIITGYDGQKYHLKNAIYSKFQLSQYEGLEIDSVDGFQGKEKDLILFSAVRSNSDLTVGFLKDSRRMNVMLTRSKRGVIVVGDRFTLMNENENWKPWLEFLSVRNAIIRAADLHLHLEQTV